MKFFIGEGQRIFSLISSVMNSVATIASGNISAAVAGVETSLAKSIPVALSFMSRIFKVSGIGTKVKNIINKVKGRIELVVSRVMDKAAALVAKMAGTGSRRPIAPGGQPRASQLPANSGLNAIPDGQIGQKVRVDGDKAPHHVWVEIQSGTPVIMMASTPMNIIEQLRGLKADARTHLDPQGNDFKTVSTRIAQSGQHVAVGISQMKTQLRTRSGANAGATSNTVKNLSRVTGALEGIAKVTLQNIRNALQPAFPLLAKANGGTLPSVGVHPLTAAGRESHHVPAAELAQVIQSQYRSVAAQLVGNTAAPVKALHDDLVRHAAAIEPVTSTRGNGLTAVLIHKDTHRECKLGNAVHKTFLADVIQNQIERDLQPGEKRVVMVITPKGKRKRIEVNPKNSAWQAFLKGVHDIAGVMRTQSSGELIEVTANENALAEVAVSITRRLKNVPAGGLAPSIAAIRTRINTVTRSAFAQARDNGVSAVRAALASSTKDGDHAQHPAILSRLAAQANTIWGALVIQSL